MLQRSLERARLPTIAQECEVPCPLCMLVAARCRRAQLSVVYLDSRCESRVFRSYVRCTCRVVVKWDRRHCGQDGEPGEPLNPYAALLPGETAPHHADTSRHARSRRTSLTHSRRGACTRSAFRRSSPGKVCRGAAWMTTMTSQTSSRTPASRSDLIITCPTLSVRIAVPRPLYIASPSHVHVRHGSSLTSRARRAT